MSTESAHRRKYRKERSETRRAGRTDKFTQREGFRLVPGGLHGWHANETETQRHSAVKKTVRRDGYRKAIERLNVLANLDENKNPGVAEKARDDMKWLQQTFGPAEREY